MIKQKKLIIFFFILYVIIGICLSVLNGISHDQYHEQLNWLINFQAIKGILFNNDNYEILKNYIDKYHGIGFHYISQPFQLVLFNFISDITQTSNIGAIYISRHIPTFIIFSISGIYFFLLCIKVSNNFNFALLSSLIFFLYPYLFGHAQINAKDIPFMSFWIISTYYLFKLIEKIYNQESILLTDIFIFSLTTSFLISIRITGFLIFIEYLISLIIFINYKKINIIYFFKKNLYFFIKFFLITVSLIYFLNPILWLDPLEIFRSLEWMSQYYHNTCTLTLGDCMRAKNLPSSYIFIWLFFKLPLIVLIGIAFFPIIEKKLFNNRINSIYYFSLLITVLTILFIMILNNVSLYDEIRHLMFLLPLIIIISLYNIFIYKKKIFMFLTILTCIFFILENISLKKYQYTWLNSFAKFTKIEKNFEVDYWGVSNKNLQRKIIEYKNQKNLSPKTCVYGDLYTNVFLEKFNFTCFGLYSQIDSIKQRPFFAYQNVRNIKRSNPKDCKLIHLEKYKYFMGSAEITVGKLWFCD